MCTTQQISSRSSQTATRHWLHMGWSPAGTCKLCLASCHKFEKNHKLGPDILRQLKDTEGGIKSPSWILKGTEGYIISIIYHHYHLSFKMIPSSQKKSFERFKMLESAPKGPWPHSKASSAAFHYSWPRRCASQHD